MRGKNVLYSKHAKVEKPALRLALKPREYEELLGGALRAIQGENTYYTEQELEERIKKFLPLPNHHYASHLVDKIVENAFTYFSKEWDDLHYKDQAEILINVERNMDKVIWSEEWQTVLK